MVYATNADGLPIFGMAPQGGGEQPRLMMNGNDVVTVDGTVVQVDQVGNPLDPADNVTAIPQPHMSVIMTIMVDDAIAARYAHGRVNLPVRGPAGPMPAGFGRTPNRVVRNTIDYSTREGIALYREATRSLYRDGEKAFGLESEGLHSFLTRLEMRARIAGWQQLLTIVIDPTSGETRNLLTQYGEVSLEDVQAKVAQFDGQYVIEVQYDEQLYTCIMASITQDAMNHVALKIQNYLAPSGENSGSLLARLVIAESTLETKSTINALWSKLTAGMPDIMAAHGNNIMAFNMDVRKIQMTLRARGQNPDYIIPQLFTVYAQCEGDDTPFGRFIEYLENSYNEGAEYDSEGLMFKAEEKYKELVERKQFTSGKTKSDEIVALQSQMEELNRKLGAAGGDPVNEETQGPKSRKQPAWMTKPPKEGEPTTKTVNGKEYHWCKGGEDTHKPKWVRHQPSACTPQKKAAAVKKEEDKPTEEQQKDSPGGWTAAMAAMYEEDEE